MFIVPMVCRSCFRKPWLSKRSGLALPLEQFLKTVKKR